MSLEAALYDILSTAAGVTVLVGGAHSPRIYPLGIPAGKNVPAVVYQHVSSDVPLSCEGDGDLRSDHIQIVCWDDDPDGARVLAEAVRAALQAASGSHGSVTVMYCSILDEGDLYEHNEQNENLSRYGKRQDWEIAYQ